MQAQVSSVRKTRLANRRRLHHHTTASVARQLISLGLLVALLAASGSAAPDRHGSAEQHQASPQLPFPQPLSSTLRTFKVTSEIVYAHDTMSRTYEEYVDLGVGKASFVSNSREGNSVTHVDADEGLVFTYAPYTCRVKSLKSPGVGRASDATELLNALGAELIVQVPEDTLGDESAAEFKPSSKYADRLPRTTKPRPLRLFGVSGLWLMALDLPKRMSWADMIYSATMDAYKSAHVWHVETSAVGVDLYFSQGAGTLVPALEMIKISSIEEKELLLTVNILAIESSIPAEAYDDVLSIPLGYGCFSALTDVAMSDADTAAESGADWPNWAEMVRMRRAFANRHFVKSDADFMGRAELEVTASVSTLDADGKRTRSSDTINVELAQTSLDSAGTRNENRVKLIRKRSTRQDTKLVLNRVFMMRYEIDMLTGGCKMSHYSNPEAEREQVLLDFANGAKFDANMDLFRDSDDLHFIKVTSAESNKRRLHHYEGTAASNELVHWIRTSTGVTEDVARRSRVVRSYELGDNALELVSLSIWLLNEAETEIVESYQIFVVEMREELAGADLAEDRARLFDVSYECYLENQQMLQNRDFAWFQLSYPVSPRVLRLVAENGHQLKQTYYERFVDDITRVPRVELVLEEDRFKIRTLLLDLPPVELAYDKLSQTNLAPSLAKHDQVNMEPDLRHCASLCRQQHCTVMSYCKASKRCTLSKRAVHDFSKMQSQGVVELRDEFNLSQDKACDTYKITALLEQQQSHRTTGLASILARLKHQDYERQIELPQAPDEVTLSESESGLSEEERQQAMLDYENKVYELLKNDNRVPECAFPVKWLGSFFFLLPDKFELEHDPMDDFHLHSSELNEDSDMGPQFDDDKVPHFHTGLNQARLNAYSAGDGQEKPVSFHLFRGASYDQCAMACWDGKCGTFSFCENGGECILSSAKTVGHAKALGLVQDAHDCLIAERDFLGNFVKFANVYRPQVYKKKTTTVLLEPSDCALDCVAETDFRCLAFQYCKDAGGQGFCYFQAAYHSANELALGSLTGCDHYARSHLADYIRLDSSRLIENIAKQLKTNSYNDLSVFECAEKCSNELVDCTAFQFCHHPELYDAISGETLAPLRECLTIESRVTKSMLKASTNNDSATVVVDESIDDGRVVQSGNLLTYAYDCQVFAMRKESSQAHLRDLALGGLITISTNADGTKPTEPTGPGSGAGFWHGLLLYVSVAGVTTIVTCGAILLTRHNELVRRQLLRFNLIKY